MTRCAAWTAIGQSLVHLAQGLLLLVSMTSGASASMILSEEGITPARSTDYVRTQTRNASTEADAVHYNPAGLPFMINGGIYLMVNSVNLYTRKSDSISMWGSQGINTLSRLVSPLQSRYQSVNMYLSTMAVAMPTGMSVIFKREKLAVYADVSALRGLPGATYTQGASTLDRLLVAYNTVLASQLSQELVGVYSNSSMKRREFHIGATVGAAYAFMDRLSASMSLRYINIRAHTRLEQTPYFVQVTGGTSLNQYQVPTLIDTDVSGNGMGIILGIDYMPLEPLNLAARLEYYPPMVLDKRTNRFIANPVIAQSGQLNEFCDSIWPLVINDRLNAGGLGNIFNMLLMDSRTRKNIGNKVKATYPLSLSLGLSYRIIPALKITTSADLAFPRARDLDGRERNWNMVGYRLGQSVEWNVAPWAAVSAGYSYNDFGLRKDRLTEHDDLLSSHTVGAGCSLMPWDFLTIHAGGSYSFYTGARHANYDFLQSVLMGNRFVYYHGWKQKLSRDEWSVSLGVTFSFFPVAAAMRKKAKEHYWKGMSDFLSNDIDSAVDEFRAARRNNIYYRDVGKKVRELEELQKIMKKNIQQEKDEKSEGEDLMNRGEGVPGDENN